MEGPARGAGPGAAPGPRQENRFRYARTHLVLDVLDNYAAAPDDPGRLDCRQPQAWI